MSIVTKPHTYSQLTWYILITTPQPSGFSRFIFLVYIHLYFSNQTFIYNIYISIIPQIRNSRCNNNTSFFYSKNQNNALRGYSFNQLPANFEQKNRLCMRIQRKTSQTQNSCKCLCVTKVCLLTSTFFLVILNSMDEQLQKTYKKKFLIFFFQKNYLHTSINFFNDKKTF